MRAIRIFALVFLSFVFDGVVTSKLAQTSPGDERLETASELFSIMTKDFMDQLLSQTMAKTWAPTEQKLSDRVDRATIVEMREEVERVVTSYLRETMKKYPPIYAKYFTTREMKDMIVFYQSPTGQKALRETPKLMGEVMGILMHTLPDMERQLELSLMDVLRRRGLQ